eukprot:scaffold276216_cov40-Tisochrysis_lutea.AAC.2
MTEFKITIVIDIVLANGARDGCLPLYRALQSRLTTPQRGRPKLQETKRSQPATLPDQDVDVVPPDSGF